MSVTDTTICVLCLFGITTAVLNIAGRKTVSEYVWDAVDHTPMLIGFLVLFGSVVARLIVLEGESVGSLVVLVLGIVLGHWCWRY